MKLTQSKEIDGVTYTVTQLPAMRSLKMLNRLGRVAGPALSRLASVAQDKPDLGALDVASLGGVLASLFENLTDSELEALTLELLSGATANNQAITPQTFDLLMQGRIGSVLKLLAFAIEVNYGSFFGALRLVASQVPAGANGST